jgi:hypothetical protein
LAPLFGSSSSGWGILQRFHTQSHKAIETHDQHPSLNGFQATTKPIQAIQFLQFVK